MLADVIFFQLIEDRNLLSGYLAMFMDDFNLAQELFLNSSKQVAALEVLENTECVQFVFRMLSNNSI